MIIVNINNDSHIVTSLVIRDNVVEGRFTHGEIKLYMADTEEEADQARRAIMTMYWKEDQYIELHEDCHLHDEVHKYMNWDT